MRTIVIAGSYKNAEELIELLKDERKFIVKAIASEEIVISNVALSVMKMVREESVRYKLGNEEFSPYESLRKLGNAITFSNEIPAKELKKSVLAAMHEYSTEIETCRGNMIGQARNYIGRADTVLTHSLTSSATLKAFFETANKFKRFRVFCTEEGISYAEYIQPESLLMCIEHTTRVVLSAAAVFLDGSCFAVPGSLTICRAAKLRSVPVFFCAAFYKITPILPHTYNAEPVGSPKTVLPFTFSKTYCYSQVINPVFDFIPAELVTSYICHTSIIVPQHVRRVLGDYYHPEDVN